MIHRRTHRPAASALVQKILNALAQFGPMERAELGALVGTTDATIKRYTSDLRLDNQLHIIARRRDEYGLEIATYAVGPGANVPRLPSLNGKSKAEFIAQRYIGHDHIPLPFLPPPCPITSALWGIRA